MATLALILAATGLVSLVSRVSAAVTGSTVSLASSLLEFAVSGLCWLVGRIAS